MKSAQVICLVLASMAAGEVLASGDDGAATPASGDQAASWGFGATLYPTIVRGGGNYTSAIAVADRGALHLEARHNYESIGTSSAFIGWTFSGGSTVSWQITPLLGGAWGTTNAFLPGLEASLSWKRLDVYIESEYVSDRRNHSDSYIYTWSELGFQPVDWLRVGLAAQRTRKYEDTPTTQRGPFAQFMFGRVTLGGFWFSPGSKNQVVVTSIGITF
ncbi:hypothetical protein [Variovorax sp. HJSM1_2]|uniref:hypothetical protein n=1 Tax=Variovorax sp. HJSM1_2 TaxID=3366263 RepID=UPI003BCECDEE